LFLNPEALKSFSRGAKPQHIANRARLRSRKKQKKKKTKKKQQNPARSPGNGEGDWAILKKTGGWGPPPGLAPRPGRPLSPPPAIIHPG